MLLPLKKWLHRQRLHAGKHDKHTHRAVSLADAKRIGILFNATNGEDRYAIDKFTERLKSFDNKILVLGFIDSNYTHDIHNHLVFTRKNLNWFLEPSGDQVQRFIEEPLDILINAYFEECLPLEYISTHSAARCRVGVYHEKKTHCYDLMINLNHRTELGFYLDQISHYLNLIKPYAYS
jgi:hypothetical protein